MTGTAGRAGAVVVTGAAQGLGRGIAEVLAGHGRPVVLVDRAPAVSDVADALGPEHAAVVGDVRDVDVLERACSLGGSTSGGLGGAAFNAGVAAPGASLDYDMDDWDRVLDVNLRAVFVGARVVRRHLPHGGSMVVLSSICAVQGFAARASYCASKAGVEGLVRSLATEWAADGVRVNAVAPGTIATEMQQEMVASGRASLDGYLARIPMGRVGQPGEIGDAVAWLLSSRSSYVTGAVLPVDGGWAGAGLPAQA
ncbi:SDR family NAD(P)-dependent oxidoreductase [Nocardioides sp. SYSU DS0663]|uniref:SDR family NAD(P)-dependent oxidoreductase n=1 Tax=Nocardioides sp. SYSU DS0663 TaxID=3416445 RepID=UPI003F4BC0F4